MTLCALSAGPASAQYFGQNKIQYRGHNWRSISADHFEVYYYEGLDSLAMRVLDLAEKTHEYLSHRMGHTLGRRVPKPGPRRFTRSRLTASGSMPNGS